MTARDDGDAVVEEFLSKAAHDLRGPLNTLELAVALLADAPDPEEVRATLGLIRDSVRDLARVADRIERRSSGP